MKKPTKILVGIATLWPFIYMVLFMLFMFSAVFFIGGPGSGDTGVPLPFLLIFPLHLLTMLAIMALTVFYIVNVFRNERVDKDKKVLWAVVLFMGNMIAMPIYWYLYIWKEPAVTSAPLPLNSADTSSWVNNANASQKQSDYVPPSEMPNWRG
jgi:hypothetical protein